MTWRPSRLTRSQMEERRLEGARLLEEGKLKQTEIACVLGVDKSAVSRWHQQLRQLGVEGLRARRSNGRPPRLDEQGQEQLLSELRKGARAQGYEDERWTLARIAEVLRETQGLRYDPDHLSLVMRKLGWSVQRPQSKAVERDETQIQTWLETTLPEALKKGR
jgi:putative transposase